MQPGQPNCGYHSEPVQENYASRGVHDLAAVGLPVDALQPWTMADPERVLERYGRLHYTSA